MYENEGEWLKVSDFALRYRFDKNTVYLMIKRGDIDSLRIGHAVRVRVRAVEESPPARELPSISSILERLVA